MPKVPKSPPTGFAVDEWIEEWIEEDELPKPIARTPRKWRRRLYMLLLAIMVITAGAMYSAYKINQFFEGHELKFRSPIQAPILVMPRTSGIILPHAEAYQKTEELSLVETARAASPEDETPSRGELLSTLTTLNVHTVSSKIYRLESGATNSSRCAAKNQFNGYGYIPGTCYATHAEVENLVEKWISTHEAMGLSTMLCYYNTGKKLADCTYYQNYLALN